MTAVQWILFNLDEAIDMLRRGKSKDEVMCFLLNFKERLSHSDEKIIDEDKTKYLN